ncbi:MAG: aromatic ring-hydroxylating dioxygenase subunit alpha [Sphingobium sp.]
MNYTSNIEPTLTESVGLSTGPVPTRLYTDPEFFELERERIFRRAWLMVGRAESIPEPGDFFVKDIEMTKASVILTRAKDGKIRAFHNACSHRGNQVTLEKEGKANRFVCRYHSWTYKNTGELVGVPDEQGFFGLDKKKCGLTPIACDIWDGWIFINFQPQPEVTLEEFLGSFGEEFQGIPYPYADHCMVMKGEIKANWKAMADNFSEFYHIPSIHPKTLAPIYASPERPGTRPIDAATFGPHRAVAGWLNTDYKGDRNPKVMKWVYPGDATVTGTQKDGGPSLADHPRVNPTNSDIWSSDVNWIFPNWHVQISGTRFWTHEFWPSTVGASKWEARFYQPKPRTARERIQLEHFTASIMDTFLEDLANIESSQLGMESGAKSFLHLHDGEILIRHSLEQVEKWTSASAVKDALE